MKRRDKTPPIAVIDIGANEIRMKIAEPGKNKLKYIESLSYPLSLGKDTFDTGKISFDKVDKACEIIKNFMVVASEYNVTDIRTVATSAVREATNRDYILDQIKIKTSLDVEVIDDTTEKLYIYKLMYYLAEGEYKKSSIMLYIGSGNVGISLIDDKKMTFMQNIRVGSLRLNELFLDLQDYSDEYYLVIEEYLDNFASHLRHSIPKEARNFIASGQEVSLIARLCDARENGIFLHISREKFINLYNEMKYKTAQRIFMDYDIPMEKAEVLLPAMSIFYNVLSLTTTNEIITPLVLLIDALIFEKLYPQEFSAVDKDFSKSTVISARKYAKRYEVDDSHGQKVEKYSLKIFDKMKKIHGLGSKEKILLQTAAILHDSGRFLNPSNHYIYSYNVVKAADLVGLDNGEKEIVASICMYHSRVTPDESHDNYGRMNTENKVLVSKLSAILRVADALDPGLQDKFNDIDVKITDNELIITIATDKNIDLEHWFFNQKRGFFQEVFGLKAVLRKRRAV